MFRRSENREDPYDLLAVNQSIKTHLYHDLRPDDIRSMTRNAARHLTHSSEHNNGSSNINWNGNPFNGIGREREFFS